MRKPAISLLPLLLSALAATAAPSTFNIVDYGANSDGRSDSTRALMSAWSAACASATDATIIVPAGTFKLGSTVTMNGPCKNRNITIQINGTLVAPSDYSSLAKEWIKFYHVDGVSIYGGTIDGNGASLWSCKASGKSCPAGASSLVFANSKNIVVSGLTSINSKLYHIVIHANTLNVRVEGVKIIAPAESPNTDGIHVQSSSPVTITGATIQTGDDCISVGPGTTNLWIENVSCGPGHGISIGSLGKTLQEAGVQNVTVKTATFTGSDNGVRIKTWAKPSTGFVRGVLFEHIVMQNVKNPIIIDQYYCNGAKNCSRQSSGVKVSGVTYSDIRGTSATPVAVKFDCSRSNPCENIKLQDVNLRYGDSAGRSSCSNVVGTSSGTVLPAGCW